jgi:hypothetical protein
MFHAYLLESGPFEFINRIGPCSDIMPERSKVEHIIKVFMTNPVAALKKVRMWLGYKWTTGTVHHK